MSNCSDDDLQNNECCDSCGSSSCNGTCGTTCNEEAEIALFKVKRYKPAISCLDACDNPFIASPEDAPKQEPTYDVILNTSAVPAAGEEVQLQVANPNVYGKLQWIYISGIGCFQITAINCDCGCPSITVLNNCGNGSAPDGNADPGTTIPKNAIFWTSKPGECPSVIDWNTQVQTVLNGVCAQGTEWAAGDSADAIIVCINGVMVAKTPGEDFTYPIMTRVGNKWVMRELSALVCEVINDCPDPDTCVESETVVALTVGNSGMVSIPAGVTRIKIQAWGGGGGSDATAPGGTGGYTEAEFAIGTAGLMVGGQIGVIVAGEGHSSGSSFNPQWDAAGGIPGFGGTGTDTGSGGWAGGGGGSFVYVGNAPLLPDSKSDVILVAGGGAGGNAGGGPTVVGEGGNQQTTSNPGGPTMEGAPNDVGTNAGAGGGGYLGGDAGSGGSGFVSGAATSSSIQFTNTVVGILNLPPGNADPNYAAGVGVSGSPSGGASNGGPGRVVITFYVDCP